MRNSGFIFLNFVFCVLSAAVLAQPANDICTGATTLPQDGTCISGTTVAAGDQWIGTVGCQTGNNVEVWFTFVANNTQANFIVTAGTLTGNIELTMVASSTADCNGTLTVAGTECEASALSDSFSVVIGTTYYVTISSSTNSQGTFNICLTSSTYIPQPGQDCSNASILCDNTAFSQATSNAGFGTQEVSPTNTCWGGGGERQSRWYKFTAGCSGTLGFNINPVDANDDYDWAIWDISSNPTSCGINPTGAPLDIGCNWSGCKGSTGISANPAGESGANNSGAGCGGSYAAWDSPLMNITAGNTYALLVDNFSTSNSGFAFNFSGTATIGPDATFSISASNCNQTVTVTKTCATANSAYFWNFGDGFTSASAGPITHTYGAGATYTISLSVTDALGCTRTYSQVVSQPSITILPASATICNGDSVDLSATIDVQPATTPVTFSNGTDVPIPNADATTGANSNITVSGITPTTLSAGMIISVCFTVNHTRHADLGNSVAVPDAITLTSPAGTIYNFTPLPSSGAGSVTYCFPVGTLDGITGNPNGIWTIHIEDNVNKTGGVTYTGTLTDWSIIFNNSNIATYAWSPTTNMTGSGTLTPTVFPTTTTTYTLTATDAFSCVFSNSVIITVNSIPAAPTAAGVTICSGSTATLTATAPGGTYEWYDASSGGTLLTTGANYTTPSLSVATTYYVQTTLNGCTSASRTPVTVSINPVLTVSNVVTTCSGDNLTYTVTFDISGGDPGTYSVTGGTGTISGGTFTSDPITSGSSYSFSASDTYDCSPQTVSGSKNCSCSASAAVSGGGTVCSGTPASDIVFTLAGTAPWSLTYNINGVAQAPVTGIAASPYTISAPAAGTYTVASISDASCSGSGSGSATVIINSLPVAIVTGGDSICADGSTANINITLTGLSPWSVTYNDGTGDSTVTGVAASPFVVTTSAAGTYTVVNVTDANSCSNAGTGSASVVVNPLPTPTISASGPTSICSGDSVTLTSTASGSYLWSSGQITQSIVVTSAGSYVVTVTDSKGCSGTSAATVVTVFSLPTPAITNSGPLSFCSGDSVTLTSSASTSYLWSNAATTQSIVVTSPGNYNVTVTDGNNCDGVSANVNVTVYSNPVAVITPSGATTFCSGGSVNLSSSASNSYLWSTTETTQGISVSSSGNFMVTITDSNGCTDSASVDVTVNPNPTSTTAATNENCGLADGTASAAGGAGTSPYTYLWDSNAGNQTNDTAVGLPAGTYSVTVTDVNSCTSVNSATVNSAGGLTATLTGNDVSCNAAADGMAVVAPSGGTTPYTFLWSGGQINDTISGISGGTYGVTVTDNVGCTYSDAQIINEPAPLLAPVTTTGVTCNGDADGLAVAIPSGGTSPYTFLWTGGVTNDTLSSISGGTYYVTVTDLNACSEIDSGTVSEPSAFTVSATTTAITCNGAGNGTATATALGGTSAYTYLWSNGQANATATGLSGGVITVTATDNNGCTATASPSVQEPNALNGTTSKVDVSCNGLSDGTATINPSGGTSPYAYSWTGGQTTSTATGLSAATYSIAITDSNDCVFSTFVTVSQPSSLTSSTTKTDILCNGDSTGNATVNPAGGTTPYSYSWSNGQTGINDTALIAGTYYVTITDDNGCTKIDSAIISQPAILNVTTTPTNILCNGDGDGQVSTTVTGGTSSYSYLWNNSQTGATATALPGGTFTVTVTDANGCKDTASSIINEPASLTATTTKTDVLCNGGNTGNASGNPSGGTSPYTYLWSNGQTGATDTALTAATYNVTVTDANGCTITGTETIGQPTPIVVSITSTDANCGASDGTATASPAGGTTPYSYLWSNGQTGATATALSAGNFNVTVTDFNGCPQTASATVANVGGLTATTSSVDALCNGNPDGLATATPSGGATPITYQWDVAAGNQTDSTATGLLAGTYGVTVTDFVGCTFDALVTVSEPALLSVSLNTTNVVCNGDSSGQVSSTVAGGTTNYTYLWSDGQTGATATGLSADTFYLTVTDNNGCTETDSAFVSEPAAITTPVSAVICSGDSIFLEGNYQNSAGTYYDTLSSLNGCDSAITTTLSLNPTYSIPVSASICSGDSILLQGNYQTSAGTFYDTLTSVNGCDSVFITTLSVNGSYSIPLTATICSGDSILLEGNYQTLPGTYSDSLSTVNGCDSILITTLTVNPSYFISGSASICPGDSIFLEGSYQTTAGVYYDSLISISGCDSIIETILAINSAYSIPVSAAICSGDSIFLEGNYQTSAGTYYDTLSSVNGCDSAITTTLSVNPGYSIPVSASICSGDSILLQGNYQNSAGTYYDTLSSVNGCDSVFITTLSVTPSYSIPLSATICSGDSILLQGNYQTAPGTYSDTLSTVSGCDSVLVTTLTVNPSYFITGSASICPGDSIFLEGNYQTSAGTYYDTLTSILACDSIIETTLILNSVFSTPIAAAICSGDSLFLQGTYQNTAGTYYDTLSSVNGCDSVIATTLSVNPVYSSTATAEICSGDSILINGIYRSVAGTYSDTLSSVNSCDSVIATTLSVNPVYSSTATAEICSGDSILINGIYRSVAGTYYDTLTTINGCDSIIITTLTVNPVSSSANSVSVCSGDSVLLQGEYQNSAGVYYDTLLSANGCDSVIITTLSVNLPPSDSITGITSFCSGGSSTLAAFESDAGTTYSWLPGGETTKSITVTTPGVYTVTIGNGCGTVSNSVNILIMPSPIADAGKDTTVFQETEVTLTASGGTGYLWSTTPPETVPAFSVTPEATTVYYVTVTNAAGCTNVDSVKITVEFKYVIFVASMFSPNGDGKNDEVFVRGKGINSINFAIYDRWGEKVFETTDIALGWDGKFNGEEMNSAVFVYVLNAIMDDGNTVERKGNITLVR